MSDFPSGGIGGLPHHVWTGTISFETVTEKQPDLEMRQIRLQGDYMQALNKTLLRQAMTLQDELMHGSQNIESGSADIYSPVLLWDHSERSLSADTDILRTINDVAFKQYLLGFELQKWSGFSDKSFRNSRLVSADAIIITLANRQNDETGKLWQQNLRDIVSKASSVWTASQSIESIERSSIVEYKFLPFSFQQYWLLVGAYTLMAIYVVISLRRLKAFHSRTGLVVTAVTQMTTSILASFTICGILKINLDQIPPEAYPLVVLTIGLENIFRLINAVLAYPPEMATTKRIANGLGDVGHASLASAVQNLAILWISSLFVSPGVAAFCAFASIALLFDFSFLVTFFVAVLNVDIRRLELQDSLSRPAAPIRKRRSSGRKTWLDALIHGEVPFTTRMAGSAITLTFVMALNWHFSDHNISSLRTSPWSAPVRSPYMPPTYINHPTSSVSNTSAISNSYDTVPEFMHVVKPGEQSFTARLYEPLVLTLRSADRSNIQVPQTTWLLSLRDFASYHFYPFALAVVFMIAFVTVLMNFLLWDDRIEVAEIELQASREKSVSSEIISTPHKLDIVYLAKSISDNVMTIGLDETIVMTCKERSGQTYTNKLFNSTNAFTLSDNLERPIIWPVDDIIIDNHSNQIAALCRDGTILLRDGTEARFRILLDCPEHHSPRRKLVFTFLENQDGKGKSQSVMLLYSDGTYYDCSTSSPAQTFNTVCPNGGAIVSAQLYDSGNGETALILLNSRGSILCYTREAKTRSWLIKNHDNVNDDIWPSVPAAIARESWLYYVPTLKLILLCTSDDVTFMDQTDISVISNLQIKDVKRHSIRVLHSSTRHCPDCGRVACNIFTIAYSQLDTGDLVLYTFSAQAKGLICLNSNQESNCKQSITKLSPSIHKLSSPGQWETSMNGCIAGVRPRFPSPPNSPSVKSKPVFSAPSSSSAIPESSSTKFPFTMMMRKRNLQPLPKKPSSAQPDNSILFSRRLSSQSSAGEKDDGGESVQWEAYIFTHKGSFISQPLEKDVGTGEVENQLYATELGLVSTLSKDSIGVVIGNCVVVVRIGENPDWNIDGEEDVDGETRGGCEAMRRMSLGRRD